jgi:hypothetical protein
VKRRLSEEEKAQTEFTEAIIAHPGIESACESLLQQIKLALAVEGVNGSGKGPYTNLTIRQSAVALRDYFQLRIARIQDEQYRETLTKIKELEGKLAP